MSLTVTRPTTARSSSKAPFVQSFVRGPRRLLPRHTSTPPEALSVELQPTSEYHTAKPAPSSEETTLSHTKKVGATWENLKSSLHRPRTLPRQFVKCPVEHMVELITYMLTEVITKNDPMHPSYGSLTRFHSRVPPGIPVRDYLLRITKHAMLDVPLLLTICYYIDLICANYPEFILNSLTVHRFLITATTVAVKGLSDRFRANKTYARIGGIPVAELNNLELEFLCRVDWRIVPTMADMVAYYGGLVSLAPGYILEPRKSR